MRLSDRNFQKAEKVTYEHTRLDLYMYDILVYDPDPISSLRRRRISTDSHDSGTSHQANQSLWPE